MSESTIEHWSGKLKPYREPPRSVWLALALLADAGWQTGDPLPQYLPREDKNAANRARYAAARYSGRLMRRSYPLTVPTKANPLVRKLWEEMMRQRVGPADLAERAGISSRTLQHWRRRNTPTLDTFEAALNVLGKRLVIANVPDDE